MTKCQKLRAITLLTAAAIAFYWKILLVRQFSNLLSYEAADQAYAWLTYWVSSVRAGSVPVWDPFAFGGHTFAGEMQTAAFNPLHLIFLLAPFRGGMLPPQSLHMVFVLIHILGAWFTYQFARELRLSSFASLTAGICFSFGGFMCRLQAWPHLLESGIWLPAILWCLLRAHKSEATRTRAAYAALSGCALALSLLAGGLHVAIMQVIAAAGFAAFLAVQSQPPGRADRAAHYRREAAVLLLVFASGVCGSAVQILPSIEYSHRAIRFLGPAAVPASQRIPFAYLGDAVRPAALVGMVAPAFNGSASTGEYVTPYLGVFPIVLALLAVTMPRRDASITFWCGVAMAAFLYSMGGVSLLYGLLYAVVPFLSMAREADRFLYLADFALAILAGYGIDVLLTHDPGARWAEFTRYFRWTALAAGVALLWPHILGKGDLSPWIALSLLFVLLAFGLFRYVDIRGEGRWSRILILAFILFDLSAFDWSAANRIEAASKNEDYLSVLRRAHRVSDFLRAQPGPFRVDISGDLPPNIGDAFGVESMRGAAVTLDTGFDRIRGHADVLNVKYLLRPASAKDSGQFIRTPIGKCTKMPLPSRARGWYIRW